MFTIFTLRENIFGKIEPYKLKIKGIKNGNMEKQFFLTPPGVCILINFHSFLTSSTVPDSLIPPLFCQLKDVIHFTFCSHLRNSFINHGSG